MSDELPPPDHRGPNGQTDAEDQHDSPWFAYGAGVSVGVFFSVFYYPTILSFGLGRTDSMFILAGVGAIVIKILMGVPLSCHPTTRPFGIGLLVSIVVALLIGLGGIGFLQVVCSPR